MIASFSGHRPNKLEKFGGYNIHDPRYEPLRTAIGNHLIEQKVSKAISGMALGIDQLAAEVCVRLGIPFIAAVPHVGQEKIWPQSSQKQYQDLLAKAAEVVIVSEGEYAAYKMQVRNEWLVDNCDILIMIWDGTNGGTSNCRNYAEKQNKKIIRINPQDFYG